MIVIMKMLLENEKKTPLDKINEIDQIISDYFEQNR